MTDSTDKREVLGAMVRAFCEKVAGKGHPNAPGVSVVVSDDEPPVAQVRVLDTDSAKAETVAKAMVDAIQTDGASAELGGQPEIVPGKKPNEFGVRLSE